MKLKFWICNKKNMGFHLIPKKKCTTFVWALGDENVIGIRSFKNYDFYEYVKFVAILLKFDILSIAV